jgi:hypothetical protein
MLLADSPQKLESTRNRWLWMIPIFRENLFLAFSALCRSIIIIPHYPNLALRSFLLVSIYTSLSDDLVFHSHLLFISLLQYISLLFFIIGLLFGVREYRLHERND